MEFLKWKSGLPSLEGEYEILHRWPNSKVAPFVLQHYFDGEKFEGAVRIIDGVRHFFTYMESAGDTWRSIAVDPRNAPND